MARSLRNPPQDRAPRWAAIDPLVPPTPLELAVVESLRARDGITRASALDKVRGRPPAELEAWLASVVPAAAPAESQPIATEVDSPLPNGPESTAEHVSFRLPPSAFRN